MKKHLLTLSCLAALATSANADFVRVEMGAGMWNQTPTGDLSYVDPTTSILAQDTSNEAEEQLSYAWILVKHPVPVLPNLRLEYAGIQSVGSATGTFQNFTATGGATSFDVTQYDVIPYYNLVDNTFWMTLDVGVDIRMMDIAYTAEGVTLNTGGGSQYTDSTTLALPLLYVRARVEIPGTHIGVEADVKYVSYDVNTVSDTRVKIDYTFDISPVVQPALEIGYRVQKLETDDGADATISMNFSGAYAGIMLRF